jgi:hypothetical protein
MSAARYRCKLLGESMLHPTGRRDFWVRSYFFLAVFFLAAFFFAGFLAAFFFAITQLLLKKVWA